MHIDRPPRLRLNHCNREQLQHLAPCRSGAGELYSRHHEW